MNNWCAGS